MVSYLVRYFRIFFSFLGGFFYGWGAGYGLWVRWMGKYDAILARIRGGRDDYVRKAR